MPFDSNPLPEDYRAYLLKKRWVLGLLAAGLGVSIVLGLSLGGVPLSFHELVNGLLKRPGSGQAGLILWSVRLPQVLAAVVAGGALAGAGAVMQSVLKNPLASPFTLGISHAAAFGAAFSVVILGSSMGPALKGFVRIPGSVFTAGCSLGFSLGTAGLIVGVAQRRSVTPEVMVLTGVAIGSLFTAGTMLLQFFADDAQLAAMVFWSFGDVARVHWQGLGGVAFCTGMALLFFMKEAFFYNAMAAGDETAKGLGVAVERVRLMGMLAASFVTSVVISSVGIIGFVGLVVPHLTRRLLGEDHRFLLPGSALLGALILPLSDLVARLILLPHVLPVSICTAFLGAPAFLWILLKGKGGGCHA